MYANNTKTEIRFNNVAAAIKAKSIAIEAIESMTNDFYFHDAVKTATLNLAVSKKSLLIPAGKADFLVHELLDVSAVLVKAIAAQLPKKEFTFEVVGMDTYTEGWIEGKCTNGKLKIKKTYFPDGYNDGLDWDDYTTEEQLIFH